MRLDKQLQNFRDKSYPKYRELFENLASGQSPETLFITCSDSRIVPALLLQTDPGDLFVIRNAGNLVPAYSPESEGTGASIEYAVSVLKVHDIVVCGHSDCGAMQGVLNPELVSSLPAVTSWLRHADASRARAAAGTSSGSEDPDLPSLIEANVLTQIDNLKTHPPVAAALAAGSLKIHGWVYHIGTGQVDVYDAETESFEAVDAQRRKGLEEVA